MAGEAIALKKRGRKREKREEKNGKSERCILFRRTMHTYARIHAWAALNMRCHVSDVGRTKEPVRAHEGFMILYFSCTRSLSLTLSRRSSFMTPLSSFLRTYILLRSDALTLPAIDIYGHRDITCLRNIARYKIHLMPASQHSYFRVSPASICTDRGTRGGGWVRDGGGRMAKDDAFGFLFSTY